MLKNALRAKIAVKAAKVLPGGWITVAALSHPKTRELGLAAARHGWREIQKRRSR